VPELGPVYLIHGDDHGAVAGRRARLRALAESGAGGMGSVEVLEGDSASPAGVAGALAAMTLSVGRRVIIVEGAERWRQADVESQLAPALAAIAPETTLAIFAREDARAKAPAALHEAVKRAGGQIAAEMTLKRWELPKWAREQGAKLGLSLDATAAKALVDQVGERQQRLLRELEKLALEGDSEDGRPTRGPRSVDVAEIEARAAHSAEYQAYGLADALVGADGPAATLAYLRLRQQGERLAGLSYLMAGRLREALSISLRLLAGESVAEVKRGLRMPARAAERLLADVARSDPERLRAALSAMAELELDTRGGSPLQARRNPLAEMEEDTLAQRAIERITRHGRGADRRGRAQP
jgi:DNA polymerase-3 subunit delta